MGQVSAKLRAYDVGDGCSGAGFAHFCPGCQKMHAIAVSVPFCNGAKWTFEGNVEAPTFTPSVNIRVGPYPRDGHVVVCHYFLLAGQLQFLGDCTHALAGRTVPLPDLPPEHQDAA